MIPCLPCANWQNGLGFSQVQTDSGATLRRYQPSRELFGQSLGRQNLKVFTIYSIILYNRHIYQIFIRFSLRLTRFSDIALPNLSSNKITLFFVYSVFYPQKNTIRMNLLAQALVQRAFQIKYGYPTEFSAEEILQEFQKRYNLALNMRQGLESDHSWAKSIDGLSLLEDPGETETERERRQSAMKRLALAAGYSPVELDLLAEEYLARLEVHWIQEG